MECKLQIADCRLQIAARWKLQICNLQFAICILLLFLAVVGLAVAAVAQELKPPKIVGVRVGIGDRYKAGLWTQVEVTLLGGSETLTGELSVIVPDGDGVPGRVTTPSDRARSCRADRRSCGSSPVSAGSTAT